MRIAVMGGRELAYGFKLAGVDAVEIEPGPEAEERFLSLANNENIAIIILSRTLFQFLRKHVAKLRVSRPLPAVLSLPDRGDPVTPVNTAQLLEEFLGLKV